MVEKFKTIVQELINKHGGVYIFSIMKMDELVDKWSVILSAPWINETNFNEIFEEVRQLVIKHLDTEELSSVARISIFPKTEHLIEELLRLQKGTTIDNQKVNGNTIYQGYIIESNPELS